MLEKKCIVILYSEGLYDSSALGVSEYLEKNNDVYVVPISDNQLTSYKKAQWLKKLYIFNNRNTPVFHKALTYIQKFSTTLEIKKTQKDIKEFKKTQKGIGIFMRNIAMKYRKIHNVLIRFDPDMVICTTSALLKKVIKAKYNLDKADLKVYCMITDYALNKRYINFKADGYLAQNDGVKQALVDNGIDEKNVYIIGTPIEEKVLISFDKQEVKKEFGVDNNNSNIVMIGGRYGSEELKNTFTKIIEASDSLNIIVITGGSDSLNKYCTYVAKSKGKTDNVFIVENIDNMAKIYSLADIIICTPTATITYEAMCHNKRVIVLRGVDGIEKKNAHYLTSNFLALRGDNPDDVMVSIEKFLNNDEFTGSVIENQKEIIGSNCAEICGDLIYKIACDINIERIELEEKRKLIQIEVKDNIEIKDENEKEKSND